MNAPVPPPVNLANLGNLASLKKAPKTRARSGLAAPLAGPLLVAAGVAVLRLAPGMIEQRRRRASMTPWIAGGVTGLGLLGVAAWQLRRLFSHEPAHDVEMRRGLLEIRRYAPARVVETTVDASWDEALDQGFRRLAGFIFGGNQSKQRIPMTAPVLGTGDGDGFRVSFVLPPGVAPSTPDDVRVALSDLPARRVAVIRFNGRHDAHSIEVHKAELTHELVANGLKPRGVAVYAGYDPPWTLPLLRRNELWVELEEQV